MLTLKPLTHTPSIRQHLVAFAKCFYHCAHGYSYSLYPIWSCKKHSVPFISCAVSLYHQLNSPLTTYCRPSAPAIDLLFLRHETEVFRSTKYRILKLSVVYDSWLWWGCSIVSSRTGFIYIIFHSTLGSGSLYKLYCPSPQHIHNTSNGSTTVCDLY